MLINLVESEIAELASPYVIEPSPAMQPSWVSRKFNSTGRVVHCVSRPDGTIVIKQISENRKPPSGAPLWLE